METISNVTNVVSKTIFGSSEPSKQEEPQSGVQGDPSKGEPFDGGNIDEQKPRPHSTADPAANKDSSMVTGDSTKAQNDVRDPSNPTTSPDKAEAAKNVDDSGEGPNTTKVQGKGPAPISDVAKAHGGDAGNVDKGGKEGEVGKSGAGGDDDGPQKESHGEGTGEKYVKSSGLKADGGDFDAANPGAGREAERLLEEKGIHRDTGPPKPSQEGSAPSESSSTPDKKKQSLKEKIKAKLHKNSSP